MFMLRCSHSTKLVNIVVHIYDLALPTQKQLSYFGSTETALLTQFTQS